MLVSHTTTHYHRRVPIQVGSRIIDQVTNCITEEELKIFIAVLEIGLCKYYYINNHHRQVTRNLAWTK